MDHPKKLKFSSYVNLSSINKMFQYRYAWVILCNVGEVIIFKQQCYISALEHIRMLILNSYVLLACISTIYEYAHAWVIYRDVRCIMGFIFWAQELYFSDLKHARWVIIWHNCSYLRHKSCLSDFMTCSTCFNME